MRRLIRSGGPLSMVAFVAATIFLAITLAITLVLVAQSTRFFSSVPLKSFLFGTEWIPTKFGSRFGIWPLLGGSLEIMLGSAVLALPVGILTAIYLNEYASTKARNLLGLPLDLLAGVPAVVYGYLSLFFVTPALKSVLPQIQASNALSAMIVVAVMILPLVSALIHDALKSVPRALRENGYALGLTKTEVLLGIVLPNCRQSILAAYILGMSRAIGETMAVTLAAGSTPNRSLDPLKSTETLSSYILSTSLGDVGVENLRYLSIFAVGLLLFIITYGASHFTRRMQGRTQMGYR